MSDCVSGSTFADVNRDGDAASADTYGYFSTGLRVRDSCSIPRRENVKTRTGGGWPQHLRRGGKRPASRAKKQAATKLRPQWAT